MSTAGVGEQNKARQRWRLLKPGASVRQYRVIQVAGQDDTRALYIAQQEDSDDLVWLVQSQASGPAGAVASAGMQAFEEAGSRFVVFPTEGTSLAALTQLVSSLKWDFLVPRWVDLLHATGYLHGKGQLFQGGRPLDVGSILFGHEAQLLSLSFTNATSKQVFNAPELANGAATPESDVYALGAALLFLLGGGTPETAFLAKKRPQGQLAARPGLGRVLARATDTDPHKRYRDADEFATALAALIPRPWSIAVPKRAPRVSPLNLVFGVLFLCFGVAAVLAALNRPLLDSLIWRPVPTPAALPPAQPDKPFGLEVINLEFMPDQQGHLDVALSREGTPVPYGPPVEFSLTVNGQAVQLTTDKVSSGSPTDNGRYRLTFAPPSPTTTGTYLVMARLIGSNLSKTIYYQAPTAGVSPTEQAMTTPESNPTVDIRSGLSGLSITGFQVDTAHYPDLVLYFTLSNKSGQAARVDGAVTVQVDQDGQRVSELVMIPNDPTNSPLTVALALDVSGSMQGEPIVNAEQAAGDFVQSLGDGDSACVYTFSTVLSLAQGCSTDHSASQNAIRRIKVGGNTALYEVIAKIADDLGRVSGRKAMIVLSDGTDTASSIGKQTALVRLQQTNIPLYGIALYSYQFQPQVLREFAVGSGGSFLEAPSSANLRQLYSLLNTQLKNQYRITFKSAFPSRNSGSMTIRLIKDGDKIESTRSFAVGK